jgi:hypothetical protein
VWASERALPVSASVEFRAQVAPCCQREERANIYVSAQMTRRYLPFIWVCTGACGCARAAAHGNSPVRHFITAAGRAKVNIPPYVRQLSTKINPVLLPFFVCFNARKAAALARS